MWSDRRDFNPDPLLRRQVSSALDDDRVVPPERIELSPTG